jgi:hypothetical protein
MLRNISGPKREDTWELGGIFPRGRESKGCLTLHLAIYEHCYGLLSSTQDRRTIKKKKKKTILIIKHISNMCVSFFQF